MESNLTFVDVSIGKVVSGVIAYEPDSGGTVCWSCPLHQQFPGNRCTRRCAVEDEINYDYMLPLIDDEVPFMDKEHAPFCSKVKIVAFDNIQIKGIGEEDNRKKYSLKNLLGKVCPGRCIILDNPKDCTKEHRKCPGCLLGELEEED